MHNFKFLQVNTFFNKGGAAEIAKNIFENSIKFSNYDGFFSYGRGDKNKNSNVYKATNDFEVYVNGIITRFVGYEGMGTYFSTKNLINFIEQNNIDLIHLHNIHGYYLNLSFIDYLKDKNFPVVWTFHDAWPFTGSCAYYFNCRKWKNGCGNCPNLRTYPTNYIDQSKNMWKKKRKIFSSGWDPVIVTPSKWLANEVKSSYLKNHKIKVINNGININIFKPQNNKNIKEKLNIPLNKKVILFVAADLEDKRKGTKHFFDSLSYLNNNDYVVVIIGKKYEEKFDNVNIEIKQLGYIYKKEKLSKIYSMSDIFCITSLDDNFPTTVLESLASGTPVVGFNVGGISEQISGNCGFCVETKNTKQFSEKVKLLLENEILNKKMSQRAREKAVENYSIENMVNSYIKVYNELLEG